MAQPNVTIFHSQKQIWTVSTVYILLLLPTLSNLDHGAVATPALPLQILLMTLGLLYPVSFLTSLLLLSPQAPGMVPATGRQSEDGIYL